jgi:hypothetical protein
MSTLNRETWYIQAISALHPLFKEQGYNIPLVKVSVGFPGGGSARKRIGEHWSPESSDDKLGSIFISPILSDSVEVLAVLVHELVHAVVGNKAGHGPAFKACAVKVGLIGKMRSTDAGDELKARLNALLVGIGPYPHGRLNLRAGPNKKQKTRMIKQECPGCSYVVRSSMMWIKNFGPVTCPCGETMQVGS